MTNTWLDFAVVENESPPSFWANQNPGTGYRGNLKISSHNDYLRWFFKAFELLLSCVLWTILRRGKKQQHYSSEEFLGIHDINFFLKFENKKAVKRSFNLRMFHNSAALYKQPTFLSTLANQGVLISINLHLYPLAIDPLKGDMTKLAYRDTFLPRSICITIYFYSIWQIYIYIHI